MQKEMSIKDFETGKKRDVLEKLKEGLSIHSGCDGKFEMS